MLPAAALTRPLPLRLPPTTTLPLPSRTLPLLLLDAPPAESVARYDAGRFRAAASPLAGSLLPRAPLSLPVLLLLLPPLLLPIVELLRALAPVLPRLRRLEPLRTGFFFLVFFRAVPVPVPPSLSAVPHSSEHELLEESLRLRGASGMESGNGVERTRLARRGDEIERWIDHRR